MKPGGVPVVMYHGIGPDRPGWPWGFLRTPLDVFENQMRLLRERGWTTITLDRLHAHMSRGASLPEKPVVLTFDDGYLDNWIYAYPILRKYGHRAVIWMSTDFIDPGCDPRPGVDDINGSMAEEGGFDDTGYLSAAEMKSMVESGHIEIQSHAQTHTWYFNGPEIVDFHRPAGVDGYIRPPWLVWNRFPETKHLPPARVPDERVPFGTPIYTYGKSLATRRYFDDPELAARLAGHVAAAGGAGFFERAGWRRELEAFAGGYGRRNDRTESEEEYEARVRGELTLSKRRIEEELGTEVHYLCWPGGGRSPRTLRIAEDVGYLATTTHYFDPDRRNIYGQDPREINRVGCGSPWVWRGRKFYRTDPEFFVAILDLFAGRKNSIWTIRAHKLKYIIRYYVRGVR